MLRFVAPAGAQLKMSDILGSLRASVWRNGHARDWPATLLQRLEVKHVFATTSGRSALWLVLRSLHRLRPERDVVALPAYTCFSVPASIVRAGLKILPVEVDPHTLEMDMAGLEAVADAKLLAAIACNLFGFPGDLPSVSRIAHSKGCYVIDDAAQAFGATRDGQFAGTQGDVGIYSLGRGKALASIEGGLIVTSSEEIAKAIEAEAKSLGSPSLSHGAWLLCAMFAYSILLRPNFYRIPNSLPFLKLGTTEFNPWFATDKIHPLSMSLLEQLIDGLSDVNKIRRANANAIMVALAGTSIFEFPRPAAGSLPTFVRFPVLALNKRTRERAIATLWSAGIGASASYPSAICDIARLVPYICGTNLHRQGAESVAERLFTLPVHPFVTSKDVGRMAKILQTFQTENS
jgi:perosamine synthetase